MFGYWAKQGHVNRRLPLQSTDFTRGIFLTALDFHLRHEGPSQYGEPSHRRGSGHRLMRRVVRTWPGSGYNVMLVRKDGRIHMHGAP